MNSSPQAFGGNPLAATEINGGNEQKRSIVNPSVGDKSLNTKEFSDVLDGENATEKVAAAGQTDNAASDGLKTDQSSEDSVFVVPATSNFSKAASNGKGLPFDGMGLPLVNNAETNGQQPLIRQAAILDNPLKKAGLSDGTPETTGDAENQDALTSAIRASETDSNTKAMSIDDNAQLVNEQLSKASSNELSENSATLVSQLSNSEIQNQAARSSFLSSTAMGLESNTVASGPKGSDAENTLSLNIAQRYDNASGVANVNASANAASANAVNVAPSTSSTISSPNAMPNAIQSNRLNLDLTKGQPTNNNSLVSEADLLRQASQSSQWVSTSLAKNGEDAAVTQSLAKSDFAQVYRTASEVSIQNTRTVDTTKQGWSDTVMQRVMWMSSQQINRAEIKLDPPELGALQVRVSTGQSDQTSVVFTSPNSAVRDALDQGLPRLREMMESQGVNLTDVSVSDQNAERRERQESTAQGGSEQGDGQGEHDDDQGLKANEAVTHKSLNLVDHYV